MTPPPTPGGKAGDYEERLAQWFLECTFFREFVFRGPPGKGGRGELADGIVLFDDSMLMVQVKAQASARAPEVWAKKNIGKALKQLSYTHRMLIDGHVTEVVSADHVAVRYAPAQYTEVDGLIVVAQTPTGPFDPASLVPDLASQKFPVHVISLDDFRELTWRFDTAGDFLSYLEMRRHMEPRPLHGEYSIVGGVAASVEKFLLARDPRIRQNVLERSAAQFRARVAGVIANGPDWQYGLAVDDIIAHLRAPDESLPWSSPPSRDMARKVTAKLAWLTRDRRIAIGKRLHELTTRRENNWFQHTLPTVGCTYVFHVWAGTRQEGVRFLHALAYAAKLKFGTKEVVGVATNPIGFPKDGRAYDVVFLDTDVPEHIAEVIAGGPDMF